MSNDNWMAALSHAPFRVSFVNIAPYENGTTVLQTKSTGAGDGRVSCEADRVMYDIPVNMMGLCSGR